MIKIAALSVQPATRPTAAPAAAPVVATPAREGEAGQPMSARDPAPALPLVAADTLGALIAVQSAGHADPQPDHGRDDEHGHQPAPTPVPPIVQPPIVQPPVVEPPAPHPTPYADAAAPARAIVMIDRALADGRVAEAERAAFSTAAAARRAAATVAQGQAALAIFAAIQTEMHAFRSQSRGRRVWS